MTAEDEKPWFPLHVRNQRKGAEMNRPRQVFRPHIIALTLTVFLAGVSGWAAEAKPSENRENWQQPDRVMSDLALKPGAIVADVGCGSGYFTFRLAKAVGEKGRVFAADIDTKALTNLKNRMEKTPSKNIETIQSEPTDTKLQPASCDAVLLCNVLHEASEPDRQPLVQSIARALKPGGFLFILDWKKSRDVPFDSYERKVARDDVIKFAADAGLSLDAEFCYLKWQVFLRFRKPLKP
jgi:ubiquinone/menaquinone biosynthesis C-methylase UbiE